MILNKPTKHQHFSTGDLQKHDARATTKKGLISRYSRVLFEAMPIINKVFKSDCTLYRQHRYRLLNGISGTNGHNLYYWPELGLYELEVPYNQGLSSHKINDTGMMAKWLYECGEAPDIQTAINRLNNWVAYE